MAAQEYPLLVLARRTCHCCPRLHPCAGGGSSRPAAAQNREGQAAQMFPVSATGLAGPALGVVPRSRLRVDPLLHVCGRGVLRVPEQGAVLATRLCAGGDSH